MNRVWRVVYLGAVIPAVVLGLGLWSPLRQAVADGRAKAPAFKVDPFWPKPLPSDNETNPAAATDGYRTSGPGATKPWVTGEVAGTCVDSKDHVFTVNRGPQNNLVSPETVISHPSPAVIEFDRAGNVVNAWPPNLPSAAPPWWTAPSDPPGCDGSPACHDATRGVPTGLHGCFVDYQDNVWIAGNGDGIVQKYTHDGRKLLLQIGRHNVCDTPSGACANPGLNNSRTLLDLPANVYVDPDPDPVTGQKGSVYVADGYGNHRVVVFDANGKWLRHWGGTVVNSANPNSNMHDRGSFANSGAGHPHCVVLANNKDLYVCDRADDRIQVFDGAPKPATCTGDPSIWVAGATPVCEPKKIISVVPGTGMTAGKSDGASKNILNTAGSAWDLRFSIDRDQSFFFEVDGGNEIVWTFDRAVAVADQATPCTTMECGTWPRGILAGFGRSGHMAGDFVFLHSLILDSKGNLFLGEVNNGQRYYKYAFKGTAR